MIKVENLSKAFGLKIAVDNISFTVERGEILGFLGPNGAGKSTSMRMITGYIPPTAGVVRVGDHDVTENPIDAKRLIGYLPESAPLYTDMTVEGFLGFCAEVRGIKGMKKGKAIDRAIEMCFLKDVRHQSVDTLSKGFRHRTCFAQSIIHDPDILVMDEPTDGLDPNQKREMRSLIRRMGQTKAIIFSTHILEEVESACTRAIVIDEGKIVANGTPDELKSKSESANSYLVNIFETDANTVRDQLGTLIQASKVTLINDKAPNITARVFPKSGGADGELGRAIFDLASQKSWKVSEIKKEEGRMDDVFRNITKSETENN
ncbi:MAG: ATP-binding cassette domain-containing protein [Verrucomicrobiota bacterium]|nr:ATP-binding cassette domain-containing protein [Verrucomicrobiota bacterium]